MNTDNIKTAKVIGNPAYKQPTDISKLAEIPVYVLNKLIRTYKESLRMSSWQTEKARLISMLDDINSIQGIELFKENLMAERYIEETIKELDNQ